MDLHFNLPQAKAHRVLVPGRSIALPWSRGVGKSWFQRVGGWYLPISQWDGVERPTEGGGTMRGIRIVHIQPTFKSCKDVHKDAVLSELEGQSAPWSFLGAQIDHTAWQFRFPGGSWIKWFGAKAAQSARGIRCDAVTIDEGDDVDPSVYDAIIKPWFSEPWSLRMILLGGTPRRGRYGLLHREHRAGLEGDTARLLTVEQLAVASPDERARLEALRLKYSFHATWRDAPKNVDAEFVAQTKAGLLAAGQKAVYQREWECDFDSAEGLVYSHFNEAVHIRRAPPGIKFTEYLFGIDHGWEDPGVILVIGVAGSGADATLYLLEEVYESHQLESWWIEQVKRVRAKYANAPQLWYADPSRGDRVTALSRGVGSRFQHVDNAIEDGVSAVAEKLAVRVDPEDPKEERKLARLYIDPSCKSTLHELVNYKRKRDPSNADRFLDDIVDKDNHCLVAGTMVTTNAGPTPIEQVPVGAKVLTRLGWRAVTASGMTFESAPIHRLTFDGGTIEGTGDHPVWTANRGWVRLNAVRADDALLGLHGTIVTVERCSPTGEHQPVYDLTVDGAHEFFANGVLVHNSMDALRYPIFNRFGKPQPKRGVGTTPLGFY